MCGLFGSAACPVGSQGSRLSALRAFPLRTLRSRRSFFEESGLLRAPRGSGPASVEAERRHVSWGSQTDLTGDVETGSALSQLSPARSSASHPAPEARAAAVTSARVEAHMMLN